MTVQLASNAAKISRPRISGNYPRQRLFDLIDQNRKRAAVWITSPPGAGKTSLVCDYLEQQSAKSVWFQLDEGDRDIPTFFYYLGQAVKKSTPRKREQIPVLTPEFNQKVTIFTRYFFRTLFARFNDKFIFVFDNCQELGDDAELHHLLVLALEELPENGSFIFISRSLPPAEYSRHQANNQLTVVDWDNIRLTPEEMQALCEQRGFPSRNLPAVMAITQGWIAGLTLLLEQKDEAVFEAPDKTEFNPGLLFNYFVKEVFHEADDDTRRLLLKTAWLPKMTVEMAVRNSGIKAAASILDELVNKHFFTHQHSTSKGFIYEYHPLFRQFLLAESEQQLGEVELKVSKWQAAELLEHDQQVEAAMELYIALQDWVKVAQVIKKVAGSLIEQGRNVILQEWLSQIPESQLNKDPWLIYWLARATKDFSVQVSIQLFEQSQQLFLQQQDVSGVYRSWSALVECIRMDFLGDVSRLDDCFEQLGELRKDYPEFPSPQVEMEVAAAMFIGLWWRQPQHQDLCYWYQRALNAADRAPDGKGCRIWVNTIMVLHLIFSGETLQAANLLKETEQSLAANTLHPYPYIMLHIANLLLVWRWGEYEAAYKHAEEALAIGEQTGFPHENNQLLSLAASIALTQNDLPRAKRYIDQHEIFDHGVSGTRYHYCKAWYELLAGDLAAARFHGEESVRIAKETGSIPFFLSLAHAGLANIHLTLGQYDDSHELIAKARDIAETINSFALLYLVNLVEARSMFMTGRQPEGLERLEKAMVIGRERNYVGASSISEADLTQLYIEALKADIEVEYVKKAIRKRGLLPSAEAVALDNWPWLIRIYCLGNAFEMQKNDKALESSRKAQKKPLAVIKALLAIGGDRVPEYKIIEAIWPDSDGDTGRQSLATTLHRLRKLLGDEVIELRDGHLSLNKQLVWVDAWAFESNADKCLAGNDRAQLKQALALYRGQFLEEDRDSYWTMQQREGLHNKYLALAAKLGSLYEQNDEWQQASECYLNALQKDMLAEQLYQRLMRCYIKLDRAGDAVKTYRQCFRLLNTRLGVEPSAQTKTLFSEIQGSDRS